MDDICPKCGSLRVKGALYCENCGYHFEIHCPKCNTVVGPEAVFCNHCGYKLEKITSSSDTSDLPLQPKPVETINPASPVKPYLKNKKAIIRAISIVGCLCILLVSFFVARSYLLNKKGRAISENTTMISMDSKEPAPPNYSFDTQKVIHPALYGYMDYIVYFRGSSETPKDMLLTIEVPGFTEKFEQKITLIPQELKLKIRPPIIEEIMDKLNTSKEAQIKVTLQDMATQKYLVQDSNPVTILSKYDMKWVEEDGSETYYENICAWVTPEAPAVKELLRKSINTLSDWSDGAINEIVGYQQISNFSPYDITYLQVAAIYDTMRNIYNVRYNATPVTTSGSGAQQRIALPEDVLKQKSGLCIETAVTMASAIEATGMHPMILILPGHAQVAVETWENNGEYLLLETTALTETNWDNILAYLDKSQWTEYLNSNQVIVIDVDLARKDGIKPMK